MQADGSHITVHTRTMAMEIFGHEFWSHDGKIIWYDLQTARVDFWLVGTTWRPASGPATT
jgi:oligogalacturonide lyase